MCIKNWMETRLVSHLATGNKASCFVAHIAPTLAANIWAEASDELQVRKCSSTSLRTGHHDYDCFITEMLKHDENVSLCNTDGNVGLCE